ncbi:hypothetical protein mRhiFer1_008719 [Rhinolophus ferrumequinum]|uniref:Uncharacterized protein n=1 Tax=Rhinolophus ferrumequinum TaxID=59479 RepID=A0A7J7TR30_RHIFE|nr:hypothetical protein mRhiFer1_008719 [Rhinolophus ferrumequinum]
MPNLKGWLLTGAWKTLGRKGTAKTLLSLTSISLCIRRCQRTILFQPGRPLVWQTAQALSSSHITISVPASVLQLSASPVLCIFLHVAISARLTSPYIMTSAMLLNAAFVTTLDLSTLVSHTTAFPHVVATVSITDPTFKAASAVSRLPAVIPFPSHKPSKIKTSKSSDVKGLFACSNEVPSNNKKKETAVLNFLFFLLILLADIPLVSIVRTPQKELSFECQFSFEFLPGGPSL